MQICSLSVLLLMFDFLFTPGKEGFDRTSVAGPETPDRGREGGGRRHDTVRRVH